MTTSPGVVAQASSAGTPIPLFHRVQVALREQILAGALTPGDALPAEPELCRRFGVSRITIRRAVDELVTEGLLYRRQGAGTFVAATRLKLDLMELRGFQEELRAQGHEPVVELLERNIRPAPADVAGRLGARVGDPYVFMRRRLSSRGEHLALSEGWFPYRTCADLVNADPGVSTYRYMEDVLGLDIAYAEQTIEPRFARAQEAELLAIPRRALLLLIERVTYLATGEPTHFGRIVQRADRYTATMVLRRRRRRPVMAIADGPAASLDRSAMEPPQNGSE